MLLDTARDYLPVTSNRRLPAEEDEARHLRRMRFESVNQANQATVMVTYTICAGTQGSRTS